MPSAVNTPADELPFQTRKAVADALARANTRAEFTRANAIKAAISKANLQAEVREKKAVERAVVTCEAKAVYEREQAIAAAIDATISKLEARLSAPEAVMERSMFCVSRLPATPARK